MALNFRELKGKTIRVMDIGSDTGNWIKRKARRNTKGIYVAVDPSYAGFPVNPATKRYLQQLAEAGAILRGTTIQKYLGVMVRNKIRVRTINADLPNWKDPKQNYIRHLIELAPQVLLPKGRIFMTLEATTIEKQSIQDCLRFAESKGFDVNVSDVHPKSFRKTHSTQTFAEFYCAPLKLLILTLKKDRRTG